MLNADNRTSRPNRPQASGFSPPTLSLPGSGRRRGSALLLAVAVLVMMVAVATAYIRTARLDSRAATLVTEQNNIDTVGRAAVEQARLTLAEDVVWTDETTTPAMSFLFDPAPQADPEAPGDEPYDYPWTNTPDRNPESTTASAQDVRNQRTVEIVNGPVPPGQVPIYGGHLDDAWLASTTPEFWNDGTFDENTPRWAHITNLNGIYLLLPSPANNNDSQPIEMPVHPVTPPGGVSAEFMSDTDLVITGSANNPRALDFGYDPNVPALSNEPFWPMGADADGDGVPDSRWTWAPIRQMGGVKYVMAVRIIDNSSLVNVNAATAMTSDGTNGVAIDINRPRGYFPTSIDLTRLLSRFQPDGPQTGDEWEDELWFATNPPPDPHDFDVGLLDYRNVNSTQNTATPFNDAFGTGLRLVDVPNGLFYPQPATYQPFEGRVGTWLENSRYYGVNENDPNMPAPQRRKFGFEDEIELRFRNGLNRLPVTSEIEKRAPITLRAEGLVGTNNDEDLDGFHEDNGDIEFFYAHVSNQQNPMVDDNGSLPAQMMARYFQGEDDGDPSTGSSVPEVELREFPALRHLLTTHSGHAVLSPFTRTLNEGIATDATPWLKYDLLFQDPNTAGIPAWADPSANRPDFLFQRLLAIFQAPAPTYDQAFTSQPQHLGGAAFTNPPGPDQIALEFALAISDYTDFDLDPNSPADPISEPTARQLGNFTYGGVEPLPFIREVYIQAGYTDIDTDGDGEFDTWVFKQDATGIAVEVGNPFDRTIPATALNGRIQVAVVQRLNDPINGPPTDIAVWTVDNAPDLPPRDPAGGDPDREHLIVYHNPVVPMLEAGGGNTPDPIRDDLVTDLGLDPNRSIQLTGLNVAEQINLGLPAGTAFIADAVVTVELRVLTPTVNDPNGEWIAYDRFTLSDPNNPALSPNRSFRLPAEELHPPSMTANNSHGQGAIARAGEGIGYLSNRNKEFVGLSADPLTMPKRLPDAFGYRELNEFHQMEADDVKGYAGGQIVGDDMLTMDPLRFQIPIANRPILSPTELAWIMMIGFRNDLATPPTDNPNLDPAMSDLFDGEDNDGDMVIDGIDNDMDGVIDGSVDVVDPDEIGDIPGRLSGVDGLGGLLELYRQHYATGGGPFEDRLFLNFFLQAPDSTGIPHAAMVLEQFTTLSPRWDGVDNDGDGVADNPAGTPGTPEQFIPGTININTMPLHLATLTAPLPETITDVQHLMQAIKAYRDHPPITAMPQVDDPNTPFNETDVRPDPASAFDATWRQEPGIAALSELMRVNPAGGGTYRMTRYFGQPLPPLFDLYPMPETQAGTENNVPPFGAVAFDLTDTPEDVAARLQFLTQAFTTRSDVFTAYVLIRGYPADDFRKGPVEQKRFLAVFDRSDVRIDPAQNNNVTVNVRLLALHEY